MTCAICTELLYQPLTLLDCLHTFCGSCLKLWFQSQASKNRDPRKNPCTCPSCRHPVRSTRSDAKINTLLELILLANPGKGKTDDEKKDIGAKYSEGEDVIPELGIARNELDVAVGRVFEEAQALGLLGHRQESRDRAENSRTATESRAWHSAESGSHARHIEHHPILRPLTSTNQVSSTPEMEHGRGRQMADESSLDGINLRDMATAQADDLRGRIADANRRRHRPGAEFPSRPHLLEVDGAHRVHRRCKSSATTEPATHQRHTKTHQHSAPGIDDKRRNASAPDVGKLPSTEPNDPVSFLTSVSCDSCDRTNSQYNFHEHNFVHNRHYHVDNARLNLYNYDGLAWHRSHQDPSHVLIGQQYLKSHAASIQLAPGPNEQTVPTVASATAATEARARRFRPGDFISSTSPLQMITQNFATLRNGVPAVSTPH